MEFCQENNRYLSREWMEINSIILAVIFKSPSSGCKFSNVRKIIVQNCSISSKRINSPKVGGMNQIDRREEEGKSG